jgi:hypothetical protein
MWHKDYLDENENMNAGYKLHMHIYNDSFINFESVFPSHEYILYMHKSKLCS